MSNWLVKTCPVCGKEFDLLGRSTETWAYKMPKQRNVKKIAKISSGEILCSYRCMMSVVHAEEEKQKQREKAQKEREMLVDRLKKNRKYREAKERTA